MDILSIALPILIHTLIGFYFVFFGIWNIYHWTPLFQLMLDKKMPHPFLILSFGIAWQMVLGSMIILGVAIKIAALLLIPSTILSVCLFHPFWHFRGERRVLHFTVFISNVTIGVGALLSLIVNHTHLP